jgi:rhombotail lipoprotein
VLIPRARFALSTLTALCLVLCAACGASQMKMASAPMAQGAAPPMPQAPPPLERSLFARDPNGALSEDALQKILAAPIELELPARVGVLPIMTATDWRGPGPDGRVPAGLATLVKSLRKDPAFSLVTQTMVIPSGSLGMEALREIAARYRLRYLLLYREVLATDSQLNRIAWGYATIVGALFLPGKHQEVYGYTEVTMFDVKTGTLMFTTRRAIAASQRSNQWHQKAKIERLASTAVEKFAPELATDVLADLRRFAAAAIAENAIKRGSGADSIVSIPNGERPALATGAR